MKVLIAFDGSPDSESAIIDLQLAGIPHGTEAVVLSVLDDLPTFQPGPAPEGAAVAQPPPGDGYDKQIAIARQGAELVHRLFPSWTVKTDVRVGAPAWEIIRYAEHAGGAAGAQPFDLTVVGSRGLGELKRLLLGSVAHRVLTTLRGSVRVARRRLDRMQIQADSGTFAAPRVIVGVDGSPDAGAAVEMIASRSWPVGTRVIVASFETGPVAMFPSQAPYTVWDQASAPFDSDATQHPAVRFVSEAAGYLRQQCPNLAVGTLVNAARPQYGLLAAAEAFDREGADCIFVGATGSRGISRFLLGSVSTAVGMNAPCSVEIVRRRF